jgi:hypothetical protein
VCPAQVVNAYVTEDQDNNIILVAVDHIKAGEEVIPIFSHVPSRWCSPVKRRGMASAGVLVCIHELATRDAAKQQGPAVLHNLVHRF